MSISDDFEIFAVWRQDWELQLKRELTPDERRFLIFANELLQKDGLRETKEAKLAQAAKGLAS